MIMLCAAAVVSLVLAFTVEKHNNVAWIEGVAIIVSVFIVSNVTAGTDYMKQFQTRTLASTLLPLLLLVRLLCPPRLHSCYNY